MNRKTNNTRFLHCLLREILGGNYAEGHAEAPKDEEIERFIEREDVQELISFFSFDDWDSIYEIINSEITSPAQKMEAAKIHNLLFQRVIYQKEVLQGRTEHTKWTDKVKIEVSIELYNKLRNHAIERKDTPNELACKVIQKYLDEYVSYE